MARAAHPVPNALTRLLELCEDPYFERCVLEALLKESDAADWRQKYNRVVRNRRLRAHAHAIFERTSLRLKHAQEYEKTIQALLLMLPVAPKLN